MTNPPSPEPVDFAELAAAARADGASATSVRQASYLGTIVAAASVAPVGEELATLVVCRRRPGRKACQAPIHVRRQQVPPAVRWRCPACEDGGTLERWQETPWDLSPYLPPPEEGEPRISLRLEAPELDLLIEELLEERAALAVLHLARPLGRSLFELEMTPEEIEAVLEAAAAMDERRSLPPERDFELYMVLQRFVDALEWHDEEEEDDREQGEPEDGGGRAGGGRAGLLRFPDGDPEGRGARAGGRPRGSDSDVPASPSIHRLRVELEDLHPPIWRRIEVPSEIDLHRLHEVVQAAFGWHDPEDPDDPQYIFDLYGDAGGRRAWCPPGVEHHYGRGFRGADRATLHGLAPAAGDRLRYVYDFSAGWTHELRVEEVRPGRLDRPRCIGGRRARPPGGEVDPRTFSRVLEALADPDHPANGELSKLLSGPLAGFDPEAFDPAESDRRLAALRQATR